MKRNPTKTQKDCMRHFKKRCEERIGYVPTQQYLKNELKHGRLKLHSRQSNSRTRFLWTQKDGTNLVLVYDKVRHVFVTVLFEGEVEDENTNDTLCGSLPMPSRM